MTTMCHCGKPLHYSDPAIQKRVQEIIDESGEFTTVQSLSTGKKYKVSRHYIALHGIHGGLLDRYGFEEIS